MAIRVKLNHLKVKTSFPYLIHTGTYNNSDWSSLSSNLYKFQRRWGVVAKVMGKTGALFKSQ